MVRLCFHADNLFSLSSRNEMMKKNPNTVVLYRTRKTRCRETAEKTILKIS
jgi:hypothetical protein